MRHARNPQEGLELTPYLVDRRSGSYLKGSALLARKSVRVGRRLSLG